MHIFFKFLKFGKKHYLKNNYLIVDFRSEKLLANAREESTYALPEKAKRGPPTNKNIPVRNMKAQITNMSLNENAGFKSEYHVRYLKKINCFIWLTFFKIKPSNEGFRRW